jgi:hypothetical protein
VRGSNARLRNKHLFTGLARCSVCGGAIAVVSGGRGSPRFGCARSWRQGTSVCTNRLTLRAKVAEPQLLMRLQGELLEPTTLAFITEQVKLAFAAVASDGSDDGLALSKRLGEERRKRNNLVGAVEEGGDNIGGLIAALKTREANIRRLEAELATIEGTPAPGHLLDDVPCWVAQQLQNLHGLLKDNPERAKAEFRRLNLHLTFTPVDVDTDNPHYVVDGQCDLSALALSFWARAGRPQGAFLARSGEQTSNA